MINKSQLAIQTNEISRNYDYCKVNYAGSAFDNIVLRNVNICVLPFETDETGKTITSLYLSKYHDFIKDKMNMSTLLYKNNEEKDESNLDTVVRCIGDTMKIPLTEKDLNRVFYLGEIELNNLISGSIPCYAVNVTGLSKLDVTSYNVSDEMVISVNKLPYVSVLRGTSQDFLIASSVFMLLSYLS